MRRKSRLACAAFLAALPLAASVPALDVDVSDPANAPSGDITVSNMTDTYVPYWYSSTGATQPEWADAGVEVSDGDLFIGDSENGLPESAGLDLSIGRLKATAQDSIVHIVSSQGKGGAGTGTTVRVGELDLAGNGHIVVGDSAKTDDGTQWQNRLIVESLDPAEGDGSLTIGKDSLVHFTQSGAVAISGMDMWGMAPFNVQLDGGTLASDGGFVFAQAIINGSGTVRGDIKLSSNETAITQLPTSEIIVLGGETQVYEGNVTIGELGGLITITGGAAGAASMTVTGTLTVDGVWAGSKAVVSGILGNQGVLAVGTLQFLNNGVVEVENYGKLIIGDGSAPVSLDMGEGKIVVADHGEVHLNGGLELAGGVAIEAPDTAVFVVGRNGLTASGTNAVRAEGSLSVLENAGDSPTQGGTGTLKTTVPEALLITQSGELLVGDFIVADSVNDGANPADIFSGTLPDGGAATPDGGVTAATFTVESAAVARGNADVSLDVLGASAIHGSYHAAGDSTTLQGAATVTGELAASGAASVGFGTATQAGQLAVDGGKLTGGAGGLELANADAATAGSLTVKNGASVSGRVDASASAGGAGFGLAVEGDLELAGVNTALAVEGYTQTSGRVTNGGQFTGDGLLVKGSQAAGVSGSGSVFAATAVFESGAAFSGGAVLAGADNTVSAVQADARITVDALSRVDLSGGDLHLLSLKSIDIDGALCLGFDTAADRATVLDLANGVELAFGQNGKIELADSFVSGVYARGDFAIDPGADPADREWVIAGNIASAPPGADGDGVLVSNLYGDYYFKYVADADASAGGGMWLDSFVAASFADPADVKKRLADMWGAEMISDSFAANAVAVARNRADSMANGGQPSTVGAYALPGDNFAGNLSYAIFLAMGAGDSAFSHTDGARTVSGKIDKGLLSAINGLAASGPVHISREIAREASRQIHGKLARDRCRWEEVRRAAGSDDALVSAVMNEHYLRRFWVSGIGLWENAGRGHGLDGYNYRGGGMTVGYDRAFGPVTAGGAFTYVNGNYEDESALAHASKIANYGFDLYGTYTHRSGWFGTATVGYTLSDNTLREYRGGNWDRADYNTGTWHMGAKIGYDCRLLERLTVSPTLGLAYLHSASDAHTWNYANLGLLRYGRMTSHVAQMPFDLAASYRFDIQPDATLTVRANAGYTYTFNDAMVDGFIDANGMGGVQSMRAIGRRLGHNAYTIGGGATYASRQMDFGLRYDYFGRADYGAHRVTGTVGVNF